MVLKYLSKLTDKIEGCTAAEQPVPDWCTKVCHDGILMFLLEVEVMAAGVKAIEVMATEVACRCGQGWCVLIVDMYHYVTSVAESKTESKSMTSLSQ